MANLLTCRRLFHGVAIRNLHCLFRLRHKLLPSPNCLRPPPKMLKILFRSQMAHRNRKKNRRTVPIPPQAQVQVLALVQAQAQALALVMGRTWDLVPKLQLWKQNTSKMRLIVLGRCLNAIASIDFWIRSPANRRKKRRTFPMIRRFQVRLNNREGDRIRNFWQN